MDDSYYYELLWSILELCENTKKSLEFLKNTKFMLPLINLLPCSTSRMQEILFNIYQKVFVFYDNCNEVNENNNYYFEYYSHNNNLYKFENIIDFILYSLASLHIEYRDNNKDKKNKKNIKNGKLVTCI